MNFLWSFSALYSLILLLHVPQECEASSFGALSCVVGSDGLGGAHLSADTLETGNLDALFSVQLDGVEITTGQDVSFIPEGAEFRMPLVVLTNDVDTTPIRGFNMLVSLQDDSATASLLLQSDRQQENTECVGVTTSGITHTSSDPKSEVSTEIFVIDPLFGQPQRTDSLQLSIDVTIVVQNSAGISRYYYSQYFIQLRSLVTLVPTVATTNQPTTMPSSGVAAAAAAATTLPTPLTTISSTAFETAIATTSQPSGTSFPTATGTSTLAPTVQGGTTVPTVGATTTVLPTPNGFTTVPTTFGSCPAFGADDEEITCQDCLEAGCSWASGQCFNQCDVIADVTCYNQEILEGQSPPDICALVVMDQENAAICYNGNTCEECVNTRQTTGDACEWYPGAEFCGTGGCNSAGCGTTTCDETTAPTTVVAETTVPTTVGDPTCPAFASGEEPSCEQCLEAGCSWTLGLCFNGCAIPDASCYNQENFGGQPDAICTLYAVEQENAVLCSGSRTCDDCVASQQTSGDFCEWYPDAAFCGTGRCGAGGCGTTECSPTAVPETFMPTTFTTSAPTVAGATNQPTVADSSGETNQPTVAGSNGGETTTEPTIAGSNGETNQPTAQESDDPVDPVEDQGAALNTIMDQLILGGAGDDEKGFATLVRALQFVGLDGVLSDTTTNYTLFAPNNRAFEQIVPLDYDHFFFTPDYYYHHKNILERYIVPDAIILASDNVDSTLETLGGDPVEKIDDIYFSVRLEPPFDFECSNGVYHGLFGFHWTFADYTPIDDYLKIAPDTNFSIFSDLLDLYQINYGDVLGSKEGGPFTLFAPNNDAVVRRWGNEDMLQLVGPDLKTSIENFIVVGSYPIERLETLSAINMMSGNSLEVKSFDEIGNSGTKIIQADTFVNNGLVHEIDQWLDSVEDFGTAVPTASPSPTAEGPAGDGGSCDYCHGGQVVPGGEVVAGVSCELWAESAALSTPESNECLLDRLLGVAFCGCPSDVTATCDVCSGSVASRTGVSKSMYNKRGNFQPDPDTVELGQEIEVEGYIMDRFCIELGTLLDNSALPTLENADKHSVHCLVDVEPCLASAFEVLLDPSPDDASGMFRRGYTLDDNSKNLIVSIARDVGVCTTCGGTGTLEEGFRARMKGIVVRPGDEASGSGPVITVDSAEAVLNLNTGIPADFEDLPLLDNPALTCNDLKDFPAVDGDSTCGLLAENYASYCGCEATPEPAPATPSPSSDTQTCTYCDRGEFSGDALFPDGTSCSVLDNSVVSAEDCIFARGLAAGFCGCLAVQGVCDVCSGVLAEQSDATALSSDFSARIIPGEVALTCSDLFSIPAVDGESTCQALFGTFAAYCGCGGTGGTVQDVLDASLNMIIFRQGLVLLNFDKLLSMPDKEFTVFAPQDEYLLNEGVLDLYGENFEAWTGHFAALLEFHLVEGATISSELLWSGAAGDSVTTVSSESLPIDANLQLVGTRSIVSPDRLADNGVIHEIDGLLYAPWMYLSIWELLQTRTGEVDTERLLQTAEGFSTLVFLIESAAFDSDTALIGFVENGTTLVAPRDVAFEGDISPSVDAVDLIRYHVVEVNNYLEELGGVVFDALPTRHPTADVLLTVDEDGVIRYNDVEVQREQFAWNGLVHEVDDILQPPGMVEILGFAHDFSDIGVRKIQQLFLATGWDPKNISSQVEVIGANRFTLFAPVDSVFDEHSYAEDFFVKLVTAPLWSRHLEHLLQSFMVSTPFEKDALLEVNEMSVETIAGGEFIYISSLSGTLEVEFGPVLGPSPSCTDGVVFFVGPGMDLPIVMQYDITSYLTVFTTSTFGNLLKDNIDLRRTSETPITAMVPPDFDDSQIPETDLEDILANHLFEDLLFLDQLLEMDGGIIRSINGKQWVVSVMGGTILLSGESGGDPAVIVFPENELENAPGEILVRNGIVYFLDRLLLDQPLDANVTASPSMDASATASPSIDANPTTSPSMDANPTASPSMDANPTSSPSMDANPTTSPSVDANPTTRPSSTFGTTGSPSPPSSSITQTVTATTAFVLSNQEGLTATDLASDHADTLNSGFSDLAARVVDEASNPEGSVGGPVYRYSVTLEPDSAEVYAVTDTSCPASSPPDSTCQLVYGRFDLNVEQGDPEAVAAKYEADFERAVENGELEALFTQKDPNFQFKVEGVATDDNDNTPSQGPSTMASQLPSNVPTLQPNQQQPPIQSPIGASKCSACDGSLDQTGSLPDGLSCSDWWQAVSQLDVESEECFIERSLGVEYCGCNAPDNAETCHPCPGNNLDPNKELPDARGLTCASLSSGVFVSTDATTCDILTSKYASWCGCPNAPEPVCTFCPSGNFEDKPFIIPNYESVSFENRVFSHIANTSCQGISDFYSVQTADACGSTGSALTFGDAPYDLNAWCACSNATAQKICGDFCPVGSTLRESFVFDNAAGLTCGEVSEIFDYVIDKEACAEANDVKDACCVARVNVSYVVSNTQGLSANDLASVESGVTLNRALADFATTLVADTEGKRRALRTPPRYRRLAATLHANSTEVVAVQTVQCPSTAPEGANCQNVYGRFDLRPEDGESYQNVSDRYDVAVEKAIEEGKMQESLDKVDPDSPFKVEGVAVTDDSGEHNNGKMAWWLILLIVLASVSGCCGILCLAAFAVALQREKSAVTAEGKDSPVAEASVRLVENETKEPMEMAPPPGEGGGDSDWESEDLEFEGSKEDSGEWDPNRDRVEVEEVNYDTEDELVSKALQEAAPAMEEAPTVAVEVNEDGSSEGWGAKDEQSEEWDQDKDSGGEWEDDSENEADEEGNKEEDPIDKMERGIDAQTQGADPPDTSGMDPPDNDDLDSDRNDQIDSDLEEEDQGDEEPADEDLESGVPVAAAASLARGVEGREDDQGPGQDHASEESDDRAVEMGAPRSAVATSEGETQDGDRLDQGKESEDENLDENAPPVVGGQEPSDESDDRGVEMGAPRSAVTTSESQDDDWPDQGRPSEDDNLGATPVVGGQGPSDEECDQEDSVGESEDDGEEDQEPEEVPTEDDGDVIAGARAAVAANEAGQDNEAMAENAGMDEVNDQDQETVDDIETSRAAPQEEEENLEDDDIQNEEWEDDEEDEEVEEIPPAEQSANRGVLPGEDNNQPAERTQDTAADEPANATTQDAREDEEHPDDEWEDDSDGDGATPIIAGAAAVGRQGADDDNEADEVESQTTGASTISGFKPVEDQFMGDEILEDIEPFSDMDLSWTHNAEGDEEDDLDQAPVTEADVSRTSAIGRLAAMADAMEKEFEFEDDEGGANVVDDEFDDDDDNMEHSLSELHAELSEVDSLATDPEELERRLQGEPSSILDMDAGPGGIGSIAVSESDDDDEVWEEDDEADDNNAPPTGNTTTN